MHKIWHASKSVTIGHMDAQTYTCTHGQPDTNMPRQLLRSWGHNKLSFSMANCRNGTMLYCNLFKTRNFIDNWFWGYPIVTLLYAIKERVDGRVFTNSTYFHQQFHEYLLLWKYLTEKEKKQQINRTSKQLLQNNPFQYKNCKFMNILNTYMYYLFCSIANFEMWQNIYIHVYYLYKIPPQSTNSTCHKIFENSWNKDPWKLKWTRICFLCENWCLPPIGVMQFCTESQVLVQQRGINSESK